MSAYGYTGRDLLAQREDYFYSALHGPDFLIAYRESRAAVLAGLPAAERPPSGAKAGYPVAEDGPVATAALLDALEADPDATWLDRLMQRFEVTKRLYETYDARLRKGQGAYDDLTLYARLAALLADRAEGPGGLARLNALLKLNDLLCSQPAGRRAEVAGLLRHAITTELALTARVGRAGGLLSDA